MRPLIFLFVLFLAAEAYLPFRATHLLGQGCYWLPRLSVGSVELSSGKPSVQDRKDQTACFVNRGLKSRQPFLYEIRRSWPSKRQLAAMDRKNHDRSFLAALPADDIKGGNTR